MNENTLWLQVPAKKTQPPNFIGLVSYDDKTVAKTSDKLECISNRLAELQSRETLSIEKTTVVFFVADQGVITDQSIVIEKDINSMQPVSTEWLNKFSAMSDTNHVINKTLNAQLEVINLGTNIKSVNIAGIINSKIDASTASFCHSPAMNNEQLTKAINIGRQSAQRIKLRGAKIFVASEINHANTLSALAMSSALLNIELDDLSEMDDKEKQVIQQALVQHKTKLTSPLDILRCLGSFEIAALTGSYLCCAHMGLPILVDGFASAVAALIASRLCPNAEQWFLYSTTPSNTAHKQIFKKLKAQPLLQTNQPLDNVAGIVMALSLLQLACNNYNQTLHFEEEKSLKRYS